MLERMIGAAKLDVKVINEIEADQNATTQAALVVIISAISAGIGSLEAGIAWLFLGIVLSLVGWAVFAGLVFWIGTTFFKEPQTHANWGQLARVLGFARTPGVFSFLGVIPFIGWLFSLIIFIWIIAASVIAIREALDYTSTGKTVVVAILAIIPWFVLSFVIGGIVAASS